MYPTDPAALIGLWVSCAFMLMIYSLLLYKENPLYRFAEHTFIGINLAIAGITAIQATQKNAITPLMQGNAIYIIPILLGLMMYTIFLKKYRWVSRYPLSLLVAVGIGMGTRGVLVSNILNQIRSSITPPTGGDPISWLNFVYIAIGTLCSISYFMLTVEHKGALKYPAWIGRSLIMIGLGATFGNTALMRLNLLAGRAEFLLQVLKIIPM